MESDCQRFGGTTQHRPDTQRKLTDGCETDPYVTQGRPTTDEPKALESNS